LIRLIVKEERVGWVEIDEGEGMYSLMMKIKLII